MKKILLLLALIVGMTATYNAKALEEPATKVSKVLATRSHISEEQTFGPNQTSFPSPFTEIGNPKTSPAVSTGYYFVDTDDDAPDYWRPNPTMYDLDQSGLWTRIERGPRCNDSTYWALHPDEGKRFFYNPALPVKSSGRSVFSPGIPATDSTNDAIAGPIPLILGDGFFFNGIRYDSFYVSTNGIVALSNRRYLYSGGVPAIPKNGTSAYDPMSMDWFVGGNRARTGDGTEATRVPDDYGYTYAACGGDVTSLTGGIRANGASGGLTQIPGKAAVIAPFFGSLHLSQWNKSTKLAEDYGQVWFKRSYSSDILVIYFINEQPLGSWSSPVGTVNFVADARSGTNENYVAASAQVVLNRLDSSITIIYGQFQGVGYVGSQIASANTLFRYNTACGVRGWARQVNYNSKDNSGTYPWASEYEQVTHYYCNYTNPDAVVPMSNSAIKFKQYKNSLRVVDIQYRVRSKNPDDDLSFSVKVPTASANNYELLAGEDRIGAIQPVALFQNLTNDIQGPQGVNFQPQELNFRARFIIKNMATHATVYNRLLDVDSLSLARPLGTHPYGPDVNLRYSTVTKSGQNYTATAAAFPGASNYNGVPPYGFVQVFFPPFEPSEFSKDSNHIGRLQCFVIAEPYKPGIGGEGMGDTWPFDDTTTVNLFVMMRLNTFKDDVSEYHLIGTSVMPSVLKWVNIGAQVVSGESASYYPLPPRGSIGARNNKNYTVMSPIIRIDRLIDGQEPANYPGGDELRSFPINLLNKVKPVLSFSVQRTAKQDDWPRGYCERSLIGPEPRTIVNGNPQDVWDDYSSSVASQFDRLDVQFAKPSPDGIDGITNIPEANWKVHPVRGNTTPITTMSAYSLYGAGGYSIGFLEADKDSSLSPTTGLRANVFDDGVDWDYVKAFVPIPNSWLNSVNDGAKNFRFRFKVNAYKTQMCQTCIPDDQDPFFIDNIAIMFPTEIADIEVASVRIQWPYTEVPASQATNIPVKVLLNNVTSVNAKAFITRVRISQGTDVNKYVYCRTVTVPYLYKSTSYTVDMPAWNARNSGDGKYHLEASIQMYPDGDYDASNNMNYTDVDIKFSNDFAYEKNPDQPVNNVPGMTSIPGRGLNLFGSAIGGFGSASSYSGGFDNIINSVGDITPTGSGQIAVKFVLNQADTIYGYKAMFSNLVQSFNTGIKLAVYGENNGLPSTDIVAGSEIRRIRAVDDISGNLIFDQYVNYILPKGIALKAGTYWVSIAQLDASGINLAASSSRSAMRMTNLTYDPNSQELGNAGNNLMLDKNFRIYDNAGRYINDNFFAYQNGAGIGPWVPFMPTSGNVGYPWTNHFGISPDESPQTTGTCTQGTWIPLLRPYLGFKESGKNKTYESCDVVPVELTSFEGQVRNNNIDLFWETASEQNNAGFNVERKLSTNKDDSWKEVGYIKGAGTSSAINHYNFTDKNLVNGVSYDYRLRQVDMDQEKACDSYSNIVTLTYNVDSDINLEQNVPNPFNTTTNIAFTLPTTSDIRLEVLDMFGNVVKTLANGVHNGTRYSYSWDGSDSNGMQVANGSYIYRLTTGNVVKTSKLTLVR